MLDPLRPAHAVEISRHARASPDVRHWLTGLLPETDEGARSFVSNCQAAADEGTAYWFALRVPGSAFAGLGWLTSIHPIHRFVNLGYWLAPEYRGRGYAGEATRALAGHAFGHLRLVRAELLIEVDNEASLRVATRAGAVREGLLRHRLMIRGAPRDAVLFSLLPSDLYGA